MYPGKNMIKFCLMLLPLVFTLFISSCNSSSVIQTVAITIQASPSTPDWVPGTVKPTRLNSTLNIEVTALPNTGCYKPFHEFAYTLSDLDFPDKQLPMPPWKIEATLPNQQMEGYSVNDIEVELSRLVNGYQEIWLAKPAGFLKNENKSAFSVYQPELEKWREIPAKIENTNLFVKDLFLTSDGTIWGKTTWQFSSDDPDPSSGSILSKFNDHTQRFELATGVLETPFTSEQYFLMPEIILDEQDTFWIFVQNDGLYRYDPVVLTTTKIADLPNFYVNDSTLASDGSIYFKDYNFSKLASSTPPFQIYEGMLFQFIPAIGKFVQLEIPDEPWPSFSGMLLTQTERLWLGTTGYQEPDGTWHLMHSDAKNYLEHAGDQSWTPPSLILESSNGLLWYQKYLGASLRNEGTAWYNPETGKGCMFTNFPSDIIEDLQQQLWLFADGKLYRYPLE